MSQAIQYNSSVAMIRHPRFLQRAADLTPTLQRLRQTPQAIVEAVAEPGALNGWRGNTVCTPEQFYQQPLNVGDSIIIDFGSHFVGYLQFSCRSVGSPPDAPAHLHFTFGETLSEVCEPFSEYQGWLSSSWLQQQDLWLDVLPARVALPRRYCLRYLKVEVKALSRKFRLQFDEIALETVTSAGSPHPAVIADPQLKAIDDVAVRTLKNCMQEVFEDGPKRDRRLWLGDLRLQAQVNDVTFGHHDLVRRCLYLFAGHTREDGMVSANVFVQPEVRADDTFLFDYSLFFVDVLYNYLQSTGDTETVGELWPTARRQIELALTRCDSQGLVRDSDDWWVFIDWQAELNKQASAQGVLIYCLQRALWLAQRFEPQRVPDYTATLWQLKEAALHHLWDNDRQVFISGAVRQVSWASQIWLVLAEVGTAGQRQALMRRLQQQPPAIAMNTPYLRHHHIVALLQSGLREEAVAEIKAYWGRWSPTAPTPSGKFSTPNILTFPRMAVSLSTVTAMRGAVPRPGLFASTDFNNNDKRVIYGRNNVYPVAAAPWLWHCRSLLQPCVADDLSVSDVLLHRRHGSPGLLCRPDVPGHPAGRRRGRRADGAGDRQYHHPLGALPPLAADRRPAFWPAVYSGLLCAGFRHHRQTAVRLCHLSVSVVPLHPGEYSVLRHAAVFNQ